MLVVDTDPVMPTDKVVRGEYRQFATDLGKAGVKIERESRCCPISPRPSRLYMRMLMALIAASFPPEVYGGARRPAHAIAGDDMSLAAERLRGIALSHRDWLMADGGRTVCEPNGANCSRRWTR